MDVDSHYNFLLKVILGIRGSVCYGFAIGIGGHLGVKIFLIPTVIAVRNTNNSSCKLVIAPCHNFQV